MCRSFSILAPFQPPNIISLFPDVTVVCAQRAEGAEPVTLGRVHVVAFICGGGGAPDGRPIPPLFIVGVRKRELGLADDEITSDDEMVRIGFAPK